MLRGARAAGLARSVVAASAGISACGKGQRRARGRQGLQPDIFTLSVAAAPARRATVGRGSGLAAEFLAG
eukprot:11155215-Lingulodinium_polyedra.AAC.1